MIPLTGPILTSQINVTMGKTSTQLFNVNAFDPRRLAQKPTVNSVISWSDFRNKTFIKSKYFGLTRSFSWVQDQIGNVTKISDFVPLTANQKFSVVVGQTGGEAGTNQGSNYNGGLIWPVYELPFTKGIASTQSYYAGSRLSTAEDKNSRVEVIYDGNDTISVRGFSDYTGSDLKHKIGTNYILSIKSENVAASKVALIQYSVTSYAAAFPLN